MSDPLQKVETGIKPLARIAAIFGVLAALGIGYNFIMDNIYKPSVKIVSVDYVKKIATLNMAGVTRTLYAGSILSAGGHWGVRFAGPEFGVYDRVELIKGDITYKVLDLSAAIYGTAPATTTPV